MATFAAWVCGLVFGLALPLATRIDGQLIAGATLFGVGWGLAGLCPGPAIVNLLTGGFKAWVFAAAMFAGMAVFEVMRRRLPQAP